MFRMADCIDDRNKELVDQDFGMILIKYSCGELEVFAV